jgi:hypothetical protein
MSRGDDAEMTVTELEELPSVTRAKDDGLHVAISGSSSREKSYGLVALDNQQEYGTQYLSWSTYKLAASPRVEEPEAAAAREMRERDRERREFGQE